MINFNTFALIMAFLLCLLFSLFKPLASALTPTENKRASSLFVEFQKAIKNGDREAASGAIEVMIAELPGAAAEVAHHEVITDAKMLALDYSRRAKALLDYNDSTKAVRDPEVVQDRKLIAEIYAITDDAVQKQQLAKEGWPAIERLNAKLQANPVKVLNSDAVLLQLRDGISFRLSLCEDLAEHAGLPRDKELLDLLDVSVKESTGLLSIATPMDRRVLAANQKVVESGNIPKNDVIGVSDANRLRMLAGLPALLLDPRLCKGAFIHSKDMFEHKFFAHESPVKGRRSFTDRAKEANTTASAENIAMGHHNPMEANKAWFLSVGHFRNFFHDGYTRIGYGTHAEHYTQLFGN